MKRKIISLLLTLLSVVCLFCVTACGKTGTASVLEKTETKLVLRIEEVEENATLLDVLDSLKEDGKLTFEFSSGMITSVNGKANKQETASSGYSWMIYTSNTELSTTEWGSTTYNGAVIGSASFGAAQLTVAKGETIVLLYESWKY